MRQPLCPYFGTCAGCDTQHIEYELQLKNKVKSLGMLTGFQHDKIGVFHGKEYNYRNRMDFIFQSGKLGLRAKGNKVMDIEACPISGEKLNELILEVSEGLGVDKSDYIKSLLLTDLRKKQEKK